MSLIEINMYGSGDVCIDELGFLIKLSKLLILKPNVVNLIPFLGEKISDAKYKNLVGILEFLLYMDNEQSVRKAQAYVAIDRADIAVNVLENIINIDKVNKNILIAYTQALSFNNQLNKAINIIELWKGVVDKDICQEMIRLYVMNNDYNKCKGILDRAINSAIDLNEMYLRKSYFGLRQLFINPLLSRQNHLSIAIKKGLDSCSRIFIWGKKNFPEIEKFAKKNNINITRVEDGFIRSIDLGSNFTRPYSLIFDDVGIYFDANKHSKLENILNTYEFDSTILNQANILHKAILTSKLSKYNTTPHKAISLSVKKNKILVAGQVESDASIKYGGVDILTNIDLLRRVRTDNPNAYIIYKPHPDVLSGNRKGRLDFNDAYLYCDDIICYTSVSNLLEVVDEVHTITSLVGLEGLLYNKKVVTYGMPFYAGWGLTNDRQVQARRIRKLTIEQLIAGTYILYPKYIDPDTLEYCQPLELINKLKNIQMDKQNKPNYQIKQFFFLLYRKAQNIFIAK
jgi:capsular polysaccharide export protein